MQDIEVKYKHSVDFLCQSYDKHMKKLAPAPEFLPLRLNIIICWKPNLDNIQVEPFECIENLLTQIEDIYNKRGDPIKNWNLEKL